MDFLNRFVGLFTRRSHAESRQFSAELQDALERGRRAKRLGKLEDALRDLDKAALLAAGVEHDTIPVVIALHKVDILTLQENWSAAQELVDVLRSTAERNESYAHLAYILCAAGALAQAQSDWVGARQQYERALGVARFAQSAGAEGRAQGHLADTYLHEGNASYAAHLLKEATPKLDQSGDIELGSYFTGRFGEALIESGKRSEGQRLLGRALRMAEQLENRRHEIMWRRALAKQAMEDGRFVEARRHLMLALAQPMAKADSIAFVLTLCRLSHICLRLDEVDASLDYGLQAATLSQENPEHESAIVARACYGIALRTAGKAELSLQLLAPIVGQYDQIGLADVDYSYVDILRNLAAAHVDSENEDEASAVYQQCITYAAAHDMPLDLAGAYRDYGILRAQLGDRAQAIEYWNKALEIFQEQRQHARVVRLYCDIANLRRQSGDLKRAMKDYESALMLLSSADDDATRGIALSNAATAYVDQGDIETAESFFLESIRIAQSLSDRAAEATRRGNYGWFLLSTGRPEQGLVTLEYAIRQSHNLELKLQVAVQTDNMGLAYDELGKFDRALDYHRQAFAALDALDFPFWKMVAAANLAHSLISLGVVDESASLLEDALVYAREIENAELFSRSLTGQARLAFVGERFADALTLVDESVRVAERGGLRRALADAYALRSDILALMGDLDRAKSDWSKAAQRYQVLRIDVASKAPRWQNDLIDQSHQPI